MTGKLKVQVKQDYSPAHPDKNSFEVILLGGRGYGESICIYLGNSDWGIVDSFYNPGTKESAPISYLNSIKADLDKVKFIVLTHYHSDHTGGMLEVVQKCPNAKLYTSCAFDSETFLNVLKVSKQVFSPKSAFAGFKEIQRHLEKTSREFKWLKQDSIVYRNSDPDYQLIRVVALSPNDSTINYFHDKIGKGMKAFKMLSKRTKPNLTSIVLLVTVGDQSVLLSSDLERTEQAQIGLDSILTTYEFEDAKPIILFKIPHHGSENGYKTEQDSTLWRKVLAEESVLIGTPFNRLAEDKKLPTVEMTKIINNFSLYSFITSNPRTKKDRNKKIIPKIRNRNRDVSRGLKKLGLNPYPLIDDGGIIRCIIEENIINVMMLGNATYFADLLETFIEV